MTLQSSGQIRVQQINAEFGGGNQLKPNATIAGISTSNVGCKSFYGLSAAIDPVYIQETPVTSTDVGGWSNGGTGTLIQAVSGKLQISERAVANKTIYRQAIAAAHRDLVCTPSTTYTVTFRQSGGVSCLAPGRVSVFGTTDFNSNSANATVLGTVNLTYSGSTVTKSFTFSSTVSAVTILVISYGTVNNSTVDGFTQVSIDQMKVEI